MKGLRHKFRRDQVKEILRAGEVTRKELAKTVGVTRRYMSKILNELSDTGFAGCIRRGHWIVLNQMDDALQMSDEELFEGLPVEEIDRLRKVANSPW